jgi:VCBS repeat-containing protein
VRSQGFLWVQKAELGSFFGFKDFTTHVNFSVGLYQEGTTIYNINTGQRAYANLNQAGFIEILGFGSNGFESSIYVGPALVPVTVTLQGYSVYDPSSFGRYSTLKLDGQGNAVVEGYSADGIKLTDMWFHNDGINGMDRFNADGSSSGFSTNLDGSYTGYTDDGHGNVVETHEPPVPPAIPSPPDVTPPPAPPTSSPDGGAPGTGNAEPTYYIISAPDGQGGSYAYQIWSNGTVYVAHLDANGNILSGGFSQTDPGYGADTMVDGNKSGWTYDVAGVPTSSYSNDALGNVTTHFYNAQGRVASSSVATTDSQGNVATSFYDAAGNLTGAGIKVAITAANGLVQETTTIYDLAGQVTGSSVVVSDGQSNSTTHNYDAAGVLLSLTTQTVTSTGAVELVFYDANRLPVSIIITDSDSQGVISTHNYDGNGKLISSVIATPDNAGNVVTCNYDATGALTSYVTLTSDSQHNTIITTCDANGFRILDNVLQPGGVEISTSYHPDGSRVSTTYNLDHSYSITTNDGMGNVTTTAYSAQEVKLSDTWSRADGSSGTDTFNADGSVSGTVTYADRTSGIILNDGHGQFTTTHYGTDGITVTGTSITTNVHGNSRTISYDANGVVTSDSWIRTDGTSGSDAFNVDGSKSSDRWAHIDGSYGSDVFNADGSRSSTVNDGHGSTTTTNYDAGGTKLNDNWTKLDGTSGSDTFNADGSYSSTVNDGHGTTTTTNYDTSGVKLDDNWTKTDGSYGSDIFNADGSSSGTTHNANGSYSNYTNDGLGNVVSTTYDVNGNKLNYSVSTADVQGIVTTVNYDAAGNELGYNITTHDGAGGTTTTNYNVAGNRLSDSWTRADGTWGSDTFNSDGSSSGTSNNPDGSYSKTSADTFGNVNTVQYDVHGQLVGDIWRSWDGSYGSDTYNADGSGSGDWYNADGSYSTYTHSDNWNVYSQLDYDANGVKINDWWGSADGSWGDDTFNADGSSSGTIHNPDGSYSDFTNDGHGTLHTLNYDAAGTLVGDSWSHVNVAPVQAVPFADQATNQGAAFTYHIPDGTFTDPDAGDNLTYTATLSDGTALPSWLIFDAATQTFSGTPLGQNVGSLNVRVTATDTGGLSISSVFALNVVAITDTNDAPVAVVDTASAQEDLGVSTSGNVLTNDSDVDQGTVLTVASAGVFAGQFGHLTINGDGSYTYALDNAAPGVQSLAEGLVVTEIFAYQATDGLVSTPSTLTITITGTNDVPVVVADTAAMQEDLGISATGNVLANDSDVDQGAVLTVANAGVFASQFGQLTLNADGSYAYALDNTSIGVQSLAEGEVVTETFAYEATDGITSTPSRLTITITGANDAPMVVADVATVQEDLSIAATGNVLANDSDVDQGTVFTVANAGVFAGQFGQLTINADGSYAYALDNASLGVQSLAEGQVVIETFSYQATDGIASTPSTLTVTITGTNDAPVTTVDAAAVQEDLSVTATGNVLANDSDVDQGTVLTVADAGVFTGQFGQLTLNADGSYTYALDNASLAVQSLAEGQVVIETFAYLATDGITSTPSMLTVTVTGTNDAPVTTVDTAAVQEDLSIAATGNVLANDTDVDQGAVLTVVNAGVFAGQFGQLTLNVDGSYTYALDNASLAVQSLAGGQTVTETFAYQATDGLASTASTLTVTITGTNDAPVVVADIVAVQEDLSISASGNVLANDSDVDQSTVLSVANAGVFAGQYGQLTLNIDGSYTYALDNASLGVQSMAEGQVVIETFAYAATDGITSTPSTLTVTITGTNDEPVVVADTVAVQEDLSISASGNVLANDSDVDQGTVLAVANAGTFAGDYGQLTLNADGSYTYDLDNGSLVVQSLAEGQVVTETFAYDATDGATSTPSTLTVTITGTNDAPVVVADTVAVQEDLGISASGNVLANDSDVDQGTVLTIANAGIFAGQFGQLTLNADGSYAYALDNASMAVQSLSEGQVVTESFTYQATDGLVSTTSTLTVSIAGTNDAPVVVADTAAVQEDLSISASGNVLANDSDIDQGTVLTVANAGVFVGQFGRLNLNVDGSYTYALDNTSLTVQSLAEGQVVTETFAYQSTDGLASTPSTLTVTITGTDDAPVLAAVIADQQTNEDVPFSFTVPADTFTDIDQGDVLSYHATLADGSALPSWLKFDAAKLTFSGIPSNWDVGVLNVSVTATDTSGLTANDTFVLDVQNVNDAPIVANHLADQHLDEGKRFSIVVPANTFDDWDIVHGDSLSYTATLANGEALPKWLTFDAATRTFSGKAKGAADLDILLTATDEVGASVSQVFNLSTGHDHHGQHHDGLPPVDTTQDEIISSSVVNDIIRTGNGADTVLFQRGDGQDTLYGGVGTDNTVVLAGGIQMSDIALSKQGNDLILETGPSTISGQAGDQITLRNWYDTTANNKSVLNLTLITEAIDDFERKGHTECESRTDQFDFTAVVNAFDQACGTSATYQHWNAANSMMAAHLEDSDDSTLGSSAFQDVNIVSLLAAAQTNQNLITAQLTQNPLQQQSGGA